MAETQGVDTASERLVPHISGTGLRLTQTAGRCGIAKSAQRWPGNNWAQGIPAGFPPGIPGIGDEIDGAMQHAPHSGLHSIFGFGTSSAFCSSSAADTIHRGDESPSLFDLHHPHFRSR